MRKPPREYYRDRRDRLMATPEGREKLLEESREKEARRKGRERARNDTPEKNKAKRAALVARLAADPELAAEYRRRANESQRRYRESMSPERRKQKQAARRPPTREEMDRKNERQNAKRREERAAAGVVPRGPRAPYGSLSPEQRKARQREARLRYVAKLKSTPEGREAEQRRQRDKQRALAAARPEEVKAKRRERWQRLMNDPEARERIRERDRAKYRSRVERDPEGMRAAWRAAYRRQAGPPAASLPSGSAYVAAAPSPARDLLRRLAALAPRRDSHDEIVAEAALLVLEGMSEAEAVKAASRNVSRGESPFRYTKPLEECFWL